MPQKTSKRVYETPKIMHDSPIENGLAGFHFDDYAATLARLIADKTTETPLVIGVSGTWGVGKTTLLWRTRTMLEPTKNLFNDKKVKRVEFDNDDENPQETWRVCRTVWFNAWKYADEDQLLVALVRVIVQAMFADDLVSKGAAALLEPFSARRDVINTVLSWFSIKVTDKAEAKLNTGEPQPTVFAEKTAILDLFDDVFDRLLSAWVHQSLDVKKLDQEKGVLVVFIDDLDRCLPAKTVQVLEAVKLFLDKKGCIFVLGADTDVVRAAVQSHYENAKVKDENADKYLEKVIQLRFELPPILPDAMRGYLKNQPRVDDAMQEQWETLIAAAEINPRRVKSVINGVNLLWTMFKNSDPRAASVERADFIRWQAIGQAAPEKFRKRVHDMDAEIRLDFMLDALRWAKGEGDETVRALFRDYEEYPRLRSALRKVVFGTKFDAAALDAFIHLTAPLEKLQPEPDLQKTVELLQPEDIVETQREGVLETVVTRSGEEPAHATVDERILLIAEMEFVKIPAGKFLIGSTDDDRLAGDREKPGHTLELPDYWMGRFPVTNEQYARFIMVMKQSHPVKDWVKKQDHPVVNVSWQDAQVYIKWLNTEYSVDLPKGYIYCLPTEAAWEKAARGPYGDFWPWGNEFDSTKCNSVEGKKSGTTPIGAYSPHGDSSYGCVDMAGNVWEWVSSLFKPYPYKAHDGREDQQKTGDRVLRGGSFDSYRQGVRCAYRFRRDAGNRDDFIGFRIALAPVENGS